MAAKDLILDFSEYDLNRVVADIEEIRRYNPQRYEMEQMTAIVYENYDRKITAGYKDQGNDEWWARGHMPGMPLLPGVLICESAAQLCSYQCSKYRLMGDSMLGFGGMDEVRFRDPVRPGSRLVVVAEMLKMRPSAMIICRFQAFVNQSLVGEGQIKGIPLPIARLKEASV